MDAEASRGAILVVDDSPQNLAVACSILRKAGFDPRPAESGPRALELAVSGDLDLVLLDVSMPGMDGFETCGRLKSDEKTRDLPVIFLTAAGTSDEDVIRGFDAGAVDYITKPVMDRILVSRVDTHVGLRRNSLELEAKNVSLAGELANRDRILYILSHDLKNSFSAVSDASAALDREWEDFDETTRREFIAAISESSGRSMGLLLRILAWSKAEIGGLAASEELLDPRLLLSEIAEELGPQVLKKEIALNLSIEEELPGIRAEGFALSTILRNLANNACKFTPKGGSIWLSAARGSRTMEFAVEDSGRGIEAEQAAGLTGAMVRSKPGTGGERGSGLGLLICGMLATRIGATISVGRREGGGTRIVVALPL